MPVAIPNEIKMQLLILDKMRRDSNKIHSNMPSRPPQDLSQGVSKHLTKYHFIIHEALSCSHKGKTLIKNLHACLQHAVISS